MLIPLKLFFIWFWHQIQKPYKTTKTQGGRNFVFLWLLWIQLPVDYLISCWKRNLDTRCMKRSAIFYVIWLILTDRYYDIGKTLLMISTGRGLLILKMGLVFVTIPLLFANLTFTIDCVDSLCCPFFRFYGLLEINLLSHKKSNLFESSHSEFIPFSISIWPSLTWIPIVWFLWKTTTLV